jgi:cobalt-precorrin-5B (C1)-methyltransferase
MEKPKGKLRTGYTTGACATAATKAALLTLIHGQPQREVEIELPIGEKAVFTLAECTLNDGSATCGVVKDAGDDPDVTHRALIKATVNWMPEPGIRLEAGEGVGVVTKPGLGLEVGVPDITRTPQKMIEGVIQEVVGAKLKKQGVRVVFSVPGGEELAKKTELPRLGVSGGIAILGNTGIVRPYSTAAFKAGIGIAIEVAAKAGHRHLVFTTGGQSEKWAMKLVNLSQEAFIQMGDFVGYALRESGRRGIEKVTIVGFPGKLSKIAMGKMQTHAAGSDVDMGFLADVAVACGATQEVAARLRAATTARHFMELVLQEKIPGVFDALCKKICEQSRAYLKHPITVEAIMTDFEGRVIGRCTLER